MAADDEFFELIELVPPSGAQDEELIDVGRVRRSDRWAHAATERFNRVPRRTRIAAIGVAGLAVAGALIGWRATRDQPPISTAAAVPPVTVPAPSLPAAPGPGGWNFYHDSSGSNGQSAVPACPPGELSSLEFSPADKVVAAVHAQLPQFHVSSGAQATDLRTNATCAFTVRSTSPEGARLRLTVTASNPGAQPGSPVTTDYMNTDGSVDRLHIEQVLADGRTLNLDLRGSSGFEVPVDAAQRLVKVAATLH